MNRHIVKNKNKEIIHCFFLVRYESSIQETKKTEYTFKIISSLPAPFHMVFFKHNEDKFYHYQSAWKKFTGLIKYASNFNLDKFRIPIDWVDEIKNDVEYLDYLKSAWLEKLPPVKVASPNTNARLFWSIRNDIICLKEMLPDLYRLETKKVSRKAFESLGLITRSQKDGYVDFYKKFNNNFHISEEERFSFCWGETDKGDESVPVLVTCIER